VKALSISAALLLFGCRETRPNVVIVVLDTARADHFSAYGYSLPTTPNFDAFAKGAILFEQAYSTSTWTLPAHASLFTGMLPVTHGATFETEFLDEEIETLAELLADAGYQTAAFSNNAWVSDRTNLMQGFERVAERWRKQHVDKGPGHGLRTNKAILRWIERRDTESPFFVFVNYIEPHMQYNPPPRFVQRFVPGIPEAERVRSLFNEIDWYMNPGSIPEELLPVRRAMYDGALAFADAVLGELVAGLRELGVWEDTLVVVTSDHGENLGEKGHLGHIFTLYQTTVRIPLAIRPSGGRDAGTTRSDPVQLTDVFATVAAAAGVTPSDGRIVGRDLLAERVPRERPVVTEYARPERILALFPDDPRAETIMAPYKRGLRSIQIGDDKLVQGSDGRRELYDVARDPGEQYNRIRDEPALASALETDLSALLEGLGRSANGPHRPPGPKDAEFEENLRALGYVP
jgi:arylsulfatase A-like enzyme